MSVPTRRGPWWYYSRTEEGKDYGIHCRRPARGPEELPPAGEPGEEEQILLDENVLAEGTDYFAVGSAAVSHDHRWLAYSTDHLGNEKYELQFRPLDAGIAGAPESVPETSYGLAWSAAADFIFYVRMDEAQRPFQLWRHQLGTDPAGDVLVFEELDRRFSLGTGSTRDTAYVLDRPAQHQHHRMARHPLGRPAGRAPCRPASPGGRGVRRRPPHARLGRHRLVHRPDQRGGPGLPGARRPGPGRPGCGGLLSGGDPTPARHPDRGRRRLRRRPRPERARRGPAPGTRPPPPRQTAPSQPTCSSRAGSSRRSRAPRRPGSAPIPSPTRPRCASAARRS